MQTFKCHLCEKEYDNYTSISLHYRKSHEVPPKVVRKLIYNNGEDPLCKCGCGEQVGWNYKEEKFNDFKHGHYVRTTGGFYSPDGARKSGETRRHRYASGEKVHHRTGKKLEEIVNEQKITTYVVERKKDGDSGTLFLLRSGPYKSRDEVFIAEKKLVALGLTPKIVDTK